MSRELELPNKKEFSNLYLGRVTVLELSEKYFVSTSVIGKWIKEFKLIKIGRYLKREDIKKLLKKNITFTKMAKQLNCSQATLKIYIKKYGFNVGKYVRTIPINIEELYELRVNSKWTFCELAELYQVTITTVEKRCKDYNFPKVKVDQEARTWLRVGGVKK